MKNLTLRVDEDVLTRARQYAGKSETSVNALVRAYLKRLAEQENRAAEVRRRIRELSETSPLRLGKKTGSRDDLHAR